MIHKTARLILFVLVCSFVSASAVSAQNLLVNPNFDQNLGGWTSSVPGAATWDTADSNGSATSGSARVTNTGSQVQFGQCVSVIPGVKYDLALRSRIPAGQASTGITFVGILYFDGANCTGAGQGTTTSAGKAETGRWVADGLFARPSNFGTALSARVELIVDRNSGSSFVANFDSVQFGPSGSFSETLVIPVAASVTGANNSAFRSDLWLFNVSKTNSLPVTLTLRCYANSPCTSVERTRTLQPRSSVQLRDIVTSLFGQPQVGGAIELKYEPSLGALAATSRLYSPASGPTYGFSMVARPSTQGLRRAVFPGLGSNGAVLTSGFRTNLGFYNPNASTANVTITLFRNDGTVLGTTAATLPPRQAQQINNLFGAVGVGTISMTDAYATVVSDVGIFSYVSVLDNGSSDASYTEGIADPE